MLIMLKGMLEMDWWFLLIKDCVLKMRMEGYKALLWSSLVLLLSSSTSVSPAIGGPFLHPPSICPPSAKTTSGYSDGFQFIICGWLYYRGWESKASSTHFLLPASLENKDQLFSVPDFRRWLLYTVRVARVWPCSAATSEDLSWLGAPHPVQNQVWGPGCGLPLCRAESKKYLD